MTREEIKELAEFDFIKGMSIEDIASKYGLNKKTVSSWRTRGKWVDKRNASLSEETTHDNATTQRSNAQQRNRNTVPSEEDKPPDNNNGLTAKQQVFAREYMKSYNATQAYINAYDVDRETADKVSYRMLGNVGVRAEIERLKKEKARKLDLSYESLLLDLAREANADIGKYVNFASHDETVVDAKGKPVLDVNGAEIIAHKSQVWLKDKANVDTSLIKKVSVGKDGVQLELHDRSKARDELLKRLAPDEELKALQIEKAKAELALAKKKLELLNGGADDNVTINIQPFGGDE
ncbi:terminase small subunit [Periweissella ghanensis]|uniref:Terminase ATPase subunit N-terminal domain-containing protein n=1 Tax=Periweissella ghanensis TaxID=467997 RepID=A0ABN8BR26_9LACO|nr:terminase small subunit [Periweissella ghanensis]MCM0600352.1 terminase small subunit [Periweissella ghanensis]CAH0419268.1 hypothetical protein WGH24286_01716 [Periweissella ghanensis]